MASVAIEDGTRTVEVEAQATGRVKEVWRKISECEREREREKASGTGCLSASSQWDNKKDWAGGKR